MSLGANLTRREQSLVAVAFAALLLAGGYWYFLHSPKNEELAKKEKRVVALEKMNQTARRDIARGSTEDLRAELARDALALEMIQTLVPTRNEVPALLEDVSTAARRVGLDIASVEPMPVLSGEDFDTYRYKLSVIGHYHAIGQFLTNVGSLRRIVAPVTIEVKSAAGNSRRRQHPGRNNPERPQLQTTFQVQTYVSRNGVEDLLPPGIEEVPPAPEAAAVTEAPVAEADEITASNSQIPESGA